MIVDEQFHMIRVAIDKVGPRPMVSVISAEANDGALYVASSLAIAFAQAGYETLLLDTTARPDYDLSPPGSSLSIANAVGVPKLYRACLAAEANGDRRVDVGTALQAVNADFAATVVHAPAVPASSVSLQAAEWATSLVISVGLGRRSSRADRTMMTLLGQNESRIIGVVPTRPKSQMIVETQEATGLLRKPAVRNPMAVELFN